MNISAITNYKFQPFTLMCAFPEVKEKLFLEVFASKDWSHPCIERVLQKPQCYPHFKYYIAYINMRLGKKMPELIKETEEIETFLTNQTCLLKPECYIALALAGELTHPLHKVNEYLVFNDQPYVVEKLLQLGFNPNEKASPLQSIKRPYVSLWDIEPEGYTPIYFATHLTAPILIKYGAQVQLNSTTYQPLDQVFECFNEEKYYESGYEETQENLAKLEKILVEHGAVYPNDLEGWGTDEDDPYWTDNDDSDRF